MAIRDRFRRALHKSDSSSNISQSDSSNITTTTTATTTSSENSSLRKQPSSRLFPWRSSDRDEQKKEKEAKKQQKKKAKSIHPRDKPLTATNLRHQEMLSGFSMTFGSSANRLSQLVSEDDFYDDGVSPCCTRHPSIDGGLVRPAALNEITGTSSSSSMSSSSDLDADAHTEPSRKFDTMPQY